MKMLLKIITSYLIVLCLMVRATQAQNLSTKVPSDGGHLRMVVILSRHGVRSPTWSQSSLDSYSALPWPAWSVAPGNLTNHGYQLIQRFGSYDRASFAQSSLLAKDDCGDVAHTYIWADTDQRTMETGRAFADGAFPGCSAPVHSLPAGTSDPLFHWSQASKKLSPGAKKPSDNHTALLDDFEVRSQEKRLIVGMQRVMLGCDPRVDCVPVHRPSIALIGEPSPRTETKEKNEAGGPLAISASFAEDFLLEYAEGMPADQVGWGHVDEATLRSFLDLHTQYFALSHGTPKTARVEASNMLFHIDRTLQQHINGQPAPGAIGPVDSKVVFLAGHDTNIAGIAALLGLHWNLDGRADDTPPGVELAFELWQNDVGAYSVRVVVSMQTLHQLRELRDLTLDSPPQGTEIALPACKESGNACAWPAFQSAVDSAIDSNFVSVSSVN